MRRNQMITIKQRKTLFFVMLSFASVTLLTKAGWAQHIRGAKEKNIDSSLRLLPTDKAEVTPVIGAQTLLLEHLEKLEQRHTDLKSIVVQLSSVKSSDVPDSASKETNEASPKKESTMAAQTNQTAIA